MELNYNYISFSESNGTLLVKTEIETSNNNQKRLEKILNRLGKNLVRAKSKLKTLEYDTITFQNFLDAENGEYSTVNEYKLDAEGLVEDEEGYEERTLENVCYIEVNSKKNRLTIKTEFEYHIFYSEKIYKRFLKFVVSFHKGCYGFDLTKEPSFAKGYENLRVLYSTYYPNSFENTKPQKKGQLRAVK